MLNLHLNCPASVSDISVGLPLPSGNIDVIFADIPFGKKFKITKDMKLLPDVFQEIERYVCSDI